MTIANESPRTIETPEHRAALEEHIADYIADNRLGGFAILARDAVEHGWHGATAEIAERLDAIVAEALGSYAVTVPYPILSKLHELTDALKKSVGA